MASQGRRTVSRLIDQLFNEAYRFEFFQAVRILERIAADSPPADHEADNPLRCAVGHDGPPSREAVRFRATAAQSFAAGAVHSLRPGNSPNAAAARDDRRPKNPPPPQMLLNFMGLTGPSGVMPDHYTALVVSDKDSALRHFFDLFNHRLISLFYRASEKYRITSGYERTCGLMPGGDAGSFLADAFTGSLLSLVGLGTGGLTNREYLDSSAVLYFGGYYSRRTRSVICLELLLEEQFGVPVRLEQFQGRWLELSLEDRSRLPARGSGALANCQLGTSLIAGSAVWETQSKFRIRMGPLTYDQYCDLQPEGPRLNKLNMMVRMYVGPEFDFDVQPVLRADEVPLCSLGGPGAPPRLGRNVWSNSRPAEKDFEGAVFEMNLS